VRLDIRHSSSTFICRHLSLRTTSYQTMLPLLLTLVPTLALTSPPRLSHSVILLPNDPHASIRLSGTGGCFEFTTDRPDILELHAEETGCVKAVTLSVREGSPIPTEEAGGTIMAREITSGASLLTEVNIENIHRLSIVTFKRRLSVGDVDELKVQGFDVFGNTFHSLEGLDFHWDIVGNTARIVHQQNDLIQMIGTLPGAIHVSVRFQAIRSDPVEIAVFEKFFPVPALVGLPYCGSTRIDLMIGHSGPLAALPSAHYTFRAPSVVAGQIAVSESGSLQSLTSANPVQSSVTVSDTRTIDNDRTFRVCVGDVSEIAIEAVSMFPMVGDSIEVSVHAISADCPHVQGLILGDSAEIEYLFSDDPSFTIERKSNTVWTVSGSVPGRTLTVHATLKSVSGESCSYAKKVEAKPITIRSARPLHVTAKDIVLPVEQLGFTIGVSGGSGQIEVASNACTSSIRDDGAIFFTGDCSGEIEIRDSLNSGNSVKLTVNRADNHTRCQLTIPTDQSGVNAYLGFADPLDVLIGVDGVGRLFNCSSLVGSVSVSDELVARVELVATDSPYSCGKIRITPLIAGKTVLHVKCAVEKCSSFSTPLFVHSPFEIRPAGVTLVGVNASTTFSVIGGNLANLPPADELVTLTNPWVGQAVANISANQIRVGCKMVGKTVVRLALTNDARTLMECVVPTGISIANGNVLPDSDHRLYITCGHNEPHVLRVVGVDADDRRIEQFAMKSITWKSGEFTGPKITVPPMACGAELTLSPSVVLGDGKSVNATISVRARDTVRSTLGPSLSGRPLYLPCDFVSSREGVFFRFGFIGGSGEYAVVGGGSDVIGGSDRMDAVYVGVPSSTQSSSYSVSMRLPGKCVDDSSIMFEVRDLKLPADVVEVDVRLEQVAGMTISAPHSGYVVVGDWWAPLVEVKFADGTRMTSEKNKRWFASTSSVFDWQVMAIGSGDQEIPVESRFNDSGVFEVRISSTPSITQIHLRIKSPKVRNCDTYTKLVAIEQPKFRSAFPQWVLPVDVVDGLELAVDGVHSENEFGVSYSFSSSNNSIVKLTNIAMGIVGLSTSSVAGSAEVCFEISNPHEDQPMYRICQSVEVVVPEGVVVNGGMSEVVLSEGLGDIVYTPSFHGVYPPVGLDGCEIDSDAETVSFAIVCDNGVYSNLVRVTRQRLPRIPPSKRILVTSDTPQSEKVVKLSPSEVGVVVYRHLQLVALPAIGVVRIVVGETIPLPVMLIDTEGGLVELTNDSNTSLRLSAGSLRPSVVRADIRGLHAEVSGVRPGCSAVFVHDGPDLVGSVEVCVDWPVLPMDQTLVLAIGSIAHLHASDKPHRVLVDGIEGVVEYSSDRPTNITGFAGYMTHEWVLSRVTPSAGAQLKSTRPGQGQLVIKGADRVAGSVRIGSVNVPFTVYPVGNLQLTPDSVRRLMHRQNMRQTVRVIPLTVSGEAYTEQGQFVEHDFRHSCSFEVDSDAEQFFFPPTARNVGNELECELVPRVSSTRILRVPKSINLRIQLVGAVFSQVLTLPLEAHFHVTTGPSLTLPVPDRLDNLIDHALELQIANLPHGYSVSDCGCNMASVGRDGKIRIERTSVDSSGTLIVITCKSQIVQFHISILPSHEIPTGAVQAIVSSMSIGSLVWHMAEWTVKLVMTALIMAGVVYLFKNVGPKEKTDKVFRSQSMVSGLKPHPHPERETFIGRVAN
jgi:hypothetical protein